MLEAADPKLANKKISFSGQISIGRGKENDIVLDPFCGSGTSMIECKLLNRKGIGIDVNVEALKLAQSRINFEWFW